MENYTFDRCTIYESFYNFAKTLPTDADRGIFYSGIIEYSLYGIEPEFKNPAIGSVFCLVKPTIDSSNSKRTNGKKPKKKQNESKEQSNGKQTANPLELALELEQELTQDSGDKSPSVQFSLEPEKPIKPEKFKKPTIEQIREYCNERKNTIDPEAFFDHYESVGWKISDKAMKNWQAAVRTWERRKVTEPAKTAFKEFGGIES